MAETTDSLESTVAGNIVIGKKALLQKLDDLNLKYPILLATYCLNYKSTYVRAHNKDYLLKLINELELEGDKIRPINNFEDENLSEGQWELLKTHNKLIPGN